MSPTTHQLLITSRVPVAGHCTCRHWTFRGVLGITSLDELHEAHTHHCIAYPQRPHARNGRRSRRRVSLLTILHGGGILLFLVLTGYILIHATDIWLAVHAHPISPTSRRP